MRRIWNVATLSKLDDLSLPMLLLDHRECCIREVQVAFDVGLEATSPTDHVHEAALVAIYVGYTESVDEAMLEGRKSRPESRVEDVVESP
jgi:hypothetical protein